ncbi:low molecular weight protein-tyrosine-phosphatase [Arcanobacterium ihumii]|uniref:low molecular weight protein-tyrosine-phosphatase n=1 Tax=Arcanobacterium ihumii TaxID=2138162 RepID=UPI000F534C1D|nr:low molecular weight protein-tyrosine-phosphatase [Arcanobacterium ihumii]
MAYCILVVCTGNICRSPMGEIVLRDRISREFANSAAEGGPAAEFLVSSAGVSSEESGNNIDSRARSVLEERGYDVKVEHLAHRATPEELQQADLILAMTVGHAHSLRRMVEDAGSEVSKIHLWREFDGTTPFAPGGVFSDDGALGLKAKNSGLYGGQKRSRYSDFYSSDGNLDVADPWYGGRDGFYRTLEIVESGADGIVNWLSNSRIM